MSETYVVRAATERSSLSVGTDNPADALDRAKQMQSPKTEVTITDRNGYKHTIAELEAHIASGKYAKPGSAPL